MKMSTAEYNDCRVAMDVATWLYDERLGRHAVTGEGLTAAMNDRRGEYLGELFPSAKKFGLPVLRAAIADMLPAGCCRWGLLRYFAKEQGVPCPPYSPALRLLFAGDRAPAAGRTRWPCTRHGYGRGGARRAGPRS